MLLISKYLIFFFNLKQPRPVPHQVFLVSILFSCFKRKPRSTRICFCNTKIQYNSSYNFIYFWLFLLGIGTSTSSSRNTSSDSSNSSSSSNSPSTSSEDSNAGVRISDGAVAGCVFWFFASVAVVIF